MSVQEIERLRDRVEELEELLGMREIFPRPWRLTAKESEVFGLLMRRPILSIPQLFSAVYGGDAEKSHKIIEVIVHNIRAKVKLFDISIQNEYGYGYFLPPESKQRARALIEAYEREFA